MKLVTTLETHAVDVGGRVLTADKAAYPVWARLLATYDEVVLFTRVRRGRDDASLRPLDGPGVSVVPAPDFVGTRGLVGAVPGLMEAALRAARQGDAFLLHAPGVTATVLHGALRVVRKPFAIEVVGDPAESLRDINRAVDAIIPIMARLLRAQVDGAIASRFVTRAALQRRYPPRAGTPTFVASDVAIPDELFDGPLPPTPPAGPLALGFVGSLARPYKGLDVLIDALARTAHPHTLGVLGDGVLRPALEARAAEAGLGGRIRFHGAVPAGAPVYEFLATRSLFVQPSRTEGMPRALLEAMAVGLPCLATPVGGVPEVLGTRELVPVDDPRALARAIDELAADPERRAALGRAHRDIAHTYRASECRRVLQAFHDAIRDETLVRTR